MMPSSIKPEFVYPGCCLAMIHTAFLFLFAKFVLVISSKSI